MRTGQFAISVLRQELDLDLTFGSGQTFRWNRNSDCSWSGPLRLSWLTLAHQGDELNVTYSGLPVTPDDVRDFLRLDVRLSDVEEAGARADRRLEPLFSRYRGLRILGQDPEECLLSFVCAVVTSIPRIRSSISELSRIFGTTIDDVNSAFPDVSTLALAPAEELRVGGMEFRCRNLSRAANDLVQRGGRAHLESLVGESYQDAVSILTSIPHVGRKVADCALLFSLGFDSASPLDTHTWRIVSALYNLPAHSKTPKGYELVSCFFRDRFGPYSGWIQQYLYLFCLKSPRGADFGGDMFL